jgi:hypothetical protein
MVPPPTSVRLWPLQEESGNPVSACCVFREAGPGLNSGIQRRLPTAALTSQREKCSGDRDVHIVVALTQGRVRHERASLCLSFAEVNAEQRRESTQQMCCFSEASGKALLRTLFSRGAEDEPEPWARRVSKRTTRAPRGANVSCVNAAAHCRPRRECKKLLP